MLKDVPVAEDTCGIYGIRPTREPPRRPPHHHRFIEVDRQPHHFPYIPPGERLNGPAYPSLTRTEDRLKTFKNWPTSMKQKPHDMAEAGFFYMNVGDKTICFYCGVGCKFWEEDDVPWEEHARWSPDCTYLLLHKGEEFVKQFKHKTAVEIRRNKAADLMPRQKEAAEEEEKSVDDKVLCKVCLAKEIGVVFRPCGHSVCLECAPALRVCHICRTPIEGYIRIFMS